VKIIEFSYKKRINNSVHLNPSGKNVLLIFYRLMTYAGKADVMITQNWASNYNDHLPYYKAVLLSLRSKLFCHAVACFYGGKKLVVLDMADIGLVRKSDLILFSKAQIIFKRELTISQTKLFGACYEGFHFGKQKNLEDKLYDKMKPICLGTERHWEENTIVNHPQYDVEITLKDKKYDVFYAGKPTSLIREGCDAFLESLQEAGLKVYYEPGKRIEQERFREIMSQSWFTLSPEGYGWQCYRHYEAMMLGSIPLVNYPTVRLVEPLLDGVHFESYNPFSSYITIADSLLSKLEDKEKLLRRCSVIKFDSQEHLSVKGIENYILKSITEYG